MEWLLSAASAYLASDWARAGAIMLASIIVGKLLLFVLSRYVRSLAQRTKTTLDDKVIDAIDSPLFLFVLLIGAYFGVAQVAALVPYAGLAEDLVAATTIACLVFLLAKVGGAVLSWYEEEVAPKKVPALLEAMPTIRNIWYAFMFVIALMMVLGRFNVDITPLLASVGVVGLAVALAFQETFANFFAGLCLSADRVVKRGDFVKLGTGEEGYVAEVGWRSTQVRTLPNNMVFIPNSKLSQSVLMNYSLPEKPMAVVVPVSVAYGSNLEKVEKVTIEVARSVLRKATGGDEKFEPFIRFSSFDPSGISFSVILRVKEFTDKYLVTHEFIKALGKRYAKEGIEIPVPKRDVYLKKPRA